MRADDFLFAAVQVLPAGGSARRQGTLRRYLPAAYTDLRTVRKALCTRQQPAEVLPGMRPLHPAQAEGRLRQTAAQLGIGNLYAVKANVFLYLKSCPKQFDVIFSDAPYDLESSEQVVRLVLENDLLRPEGVR